MSLFHMKSVQSYDNANQLRSNLGAYLLMFDTLLRLNSEGQQAYKNQEFETENSIFEKNTRILVGMRALFRQKRSSSEIAMFDFFSALLDTTFLFPEYDDRKYYYQDLLTQISNVHQLWKTTHEPTSDTIYPV